MRKISRYNDPKNYTHRFFDNGVSEEKTLTAVYVMHGEKEVVSQNMKPGEWTPWQDLFQELDALDLAIIEEVARSRYLSSLLIYQLVSLRGFTVNRNRIKRHLKNLREKHVLMQLEIDRYLRSHGLYSEQDSLLYTEDLLHMKKTLKNLYELDEKGNQLWYRLPGGETQKKEAGRTA